MIKIFGDYSIINRSKSIKEKINMTRTTLILAALCLLFTVSCSRSSTSDMVYVPGSHSGITLVDDVADGRCQIQEVAGRKAIVLMQNTTPRSLYMYFKLTPELRTMLGSDFYVIVDAYVDGLKGVRVEYNGEKSPYTEAPSLVYVGSGEWQTTYTHITDAKLTGAQNGGADFRLAGGEDLVVARVEVSKVKPSIDTQTAKEKLQSYLKEHPMKTDMFYTFGNDADETSALLYKSLGVTSVESYVTWESCEGKGEGQWDWSKWDKQVKILQDADLKWVPFLILGPAYSTPDWFRSSKEHFPCRCLEHGINSKIESLWNPNLPARIDRFISEFAKRYKDTGVIESVLLGIQGDYGEAIYSVSGGGWTFNIPGEYHNHPGFWCGDEYALKDFRSHMRNKYNSIALLNKAWGTSFSSFDVIDMPGRGHELEVFRGKIPSGDPGIRRRWLDFIDWYRGAMTNWADWWMMTTRKHFPDTPIYLCTGGDAAPEHGSDFAEQSRVAAKHKAGVRITNEGSNYALNFSITRWVASAGKHYGAYFGFEPASVVNEKGIVARIYNATASGANQLHEYNTNIVNSSKTINVQKAHFKYLFHVPNPIVPVAVWYPNVSLTLKWGGFLEKVQTLRDYVDVDYVDETMLRTGGLGRNKILVILHGDVMESSDAVRIAQWIKSGGRVIVMDIPKFESVERNNVPEKTLFGVTPEGRTIGSGSIVRVFGWKSLVSELRKTLADLNLPVYDLEQDGLYGTQINDKEFLFLNTGDSKKITINKAHDGKDFDILGETITRVQFD